MRFFSGLSIECCLGAQPQAIESNVTFLIPQIAGLPQTEPAPLCPVADFLRALLVYWPPLGRNPSNFPGGQTPQIVTFRTIFEQAVLPITSFPRLPPTWRFITRNLSNVAFHWALDHLPERAENAAGLRSSRNRGCESVLDNNAGHSSPKWVVL
jgi:hypothetical protein